ncbi:MAG: MCP four helix bundle domain-containing protein, partial [Proteobacteria bacterium]|nr:MCP four helix bundle domain-containing protein [Pseudomonadota bacterium]
MTGKLWLAFGLLVLVLGISGLVSYRSIQRIDRNLRQIVAVEEPLEQAVLEMEINAGETARAVLDYVRDLEPKHIEAMRDSEADFERFAADFERLAETDEERRLGREVAGLYGEFKALGDEIVALADRRRGALETFRRYALEIDELIEEKLQKVIDITTPEGMKKWQAAATLNELIDESLAAIVGYMLHPEPALRREVMDAEADFERIEAVYRETSLSAGEAALLERIDRDFVEAVTAGAGIMTVTDRLNTQIEIFEERLETLDALLDDEIQPLILGATAAAAVDAKDSADRAALYIVVLGLGSLCIAGTAAWAISRTIVGPIRALVNGTKIVGGGDEFGHLAVAFNRMAEKLGHALQSAEDARTQLERRVEDRTSELRATQDELLLRERLATLGQLTATVSH